MIFIEISGKSSPLLKMDILQVLAISYIGPPSTKYKLLITLVKENG